MSNPERETIREVRYVSCCSPVFWGVVLVLIGVVGLLPNDLSRYAWPTVALVAGLWLLFGPLDWRRERPYPRHEDPYDRM